MIILNVILFLKLLEALVSNRIIPVTVKEQESKIRLEGTIEPAEPTSGSEMPEIRKESTNCCTGCCGLAISIILLVFTYNILQIFALLYLGTSLLCIFDKRSKEIYFNEDPDNKEYEFPDEAILVQKGDNPGWALKMKDWGYIYRVYERGLLKSNPDVRKYDVFLLIIITGGLTGLMWFILSVYDIEKFSKTKWSYACPVRFE